MQTTFSSTKRSSSISINFIVPGSWEEMSDKQLRYVYQLMADNFSTDEVKTLFLLKWSGTKVIGRQDSSPSEATPSVTGSYLVKLGKQMFELTPLTLAELLVNLDWLGATPTSPVRPSKMNRRQALAADFQGVPFETSLIVPAKMWKPFLFFVPILFLNF